MYLSISKEYRPIRAIALIGHKGIFQKGIITPLRLVSNS